MDQSTLDFLLAGLFARDRLLRVRVPVRDELPSLLELPSVRAWFADEKHGKVREREQHEELLVQRAVSAAIAPAALYATPATVRYEQHVSYALSSTALSQEFYVHVPSWVKVHRAPFHTFGANLFGLAYTMTGDIHIREDLTGDEFSEVLQHEVFHQLYPNCSEQQVRQFTLARFGERAAIHHKIGTAH